MMLFILIYICDTQVQNYQKEALHGSCGNRSQTQSLQIPNRPISFSFFLSLLKSL